MRYFCTYFDQNYLTRGLSLYESLKRHCPEFRLEILCLDEESRKQLTGHSFPECRITSLQDFETADPDLLKTKASRTIVEYYFTLTPCLIRHLLEGIPEDEILTYLDADLYFYSTPEPVFEELAEGSIGIISHRFPEEFAHMNFHGIYNVGWVSFRNNELGRSCSGWWRERCLEWCYDKVDEGRYADQAYLDDWPARFQGTVVIQNPGANVAPWNVGQYQIGEGDEGVTIDGHKLIFYHFHALRKIAGHLFDSQLSKYGVDVSENVRRNIYKPYLEALYENGLRLSSPTPADAQTLERRFDLIPLTVEDDSRVTAEQAKVEQYVYSNLALAERDRGARQGVIVRLQSGCDELTTKCKEQEALIDNLTDTVMRNALENQSIVRKIKSKIAKKFSKNYWMKLGVLRQYEPRKMQLEKFPPSARAIEDLPSISIVTPSFMQGHFLERTMQSVLSQEYPRMQYIVQDGGSKDNSVEVIKRHASKLASWVSAPDDGQSAAVKRGFENCEADVMAWLNSDDMLMPGSLRYIGEYFAAHPEVDAIYGHRVIIDENDNEIGRWVLPRHDWKILRWSDFVPQETLFWRRGLWEKSGGVDPNFRFALDWDLLLKFEKAGANVVRLPYFLGCFRTHAAQKTVAEMVNSHGEQEMARIRERVHGRRISNYELVPHVEGFCLHGIKTSCLLSLGIRS